MRPARALSLCLVVTAAVMSGLFGACTVLLPTEDLLVFCVRPEECPAGLSCSAGVCLPDGPGEDAGTADEADDLGEEGDVSGDSDGGPES